MSKSNHKEALERTEMHTLEVHFVCGLQICPEEVKDVVVPRSVTDTLTASQYAVIPYCSHGQMIPQ